MKLTVERLPESRVVLEIASDDEEFAKAMERAYRRVGQQVSLQGFRKGKAPRAMIERAYGRQIFLEEAHRLLMDDLYRQALEEAAVRPVGEPEVEITEIEPLAFKVVVPVYPEVEAGAYTDVRVEPIDAAVDEAAVDEEIDRLRKANSPWVDPESEGMEVGPDLVLTPKTRTAREGDQVTIDYEVFEEGDEETVEREEDAQFVLGESGLLERLEREIEHLHVGETAEFTAEFAEDDAVVDPGLRGKTMHYRVALKGLKERDLLPMDDEFARTVGETETLAELRDQVRQAVHQERTGNARAEVLTKAIAAMAEAATIDLPAAMIDEQVGEDVTAMRQRLAQRGLALEAYLRMTDQTEEDLRGELRGEAERKLRQSLLLQELARREEIAVDETELDAAVARMVAGAAGAREPEQAAQFFRSDYVRRSLRNELFDRALQDRLIDIVTEGRGAVINPWEPPAAVEAETEANAPESDAEPAAETAAVAETTPADAEAVETTPAGGA